MRRPRHASNSKAARASIAASSKLRSGNVDTVNDFAPGKDTFLLSKHAFKGIGGKGKLDKDAFVTGSKAKDGADRIIYDKDTGAVGFDKDGEGGNGIKTFAVVEAGLDLKHDDFVVVA